MDVNEAIERLYSLQKFGIKLGLSNIENLLEHIGNPQNSLKAIHIAGTNGKGSTSSFLASILMECGYKTGLYTSPHFVQFNERVRINGKEIPDEYIAEFVANNNDFITEHKLTFFEVTTALAFRYFADQRVDYAVIETGLGGRLDATNTISPVASVITSISLEHTEILGDTIEQIAGEKGGIIKKSSKVFLGRLPFKAENVLIDISRDLGTEVFKVADYTNEQKGSLGYVSPLLTFDSIETPLRGIYQKYNASLAILVLSEALGIVNPELITKGINNVIKNSGIQGRYEIYSESPRVIFDSAHNKEGIDSFLTAFGEEARNYGSKVLLFGAMRDKAIEEMLQSLNPFFDEIRFNSIDYQRAATVDDLAFIARKLGLRFKMENSGADYILDFLRTHGPSDCLVVLGSMYVLGEIKKQLLTKKKLDIFSQ